jgi:hypothetical protein
MMSDVSRGLFGKTMFFKKNKKLYANSHAVVIGVDAYHQMPGLSAAVKDAKIMSASVSNGYALRWWVSAFVSAEPIIPAEPAFPSSDY